MTDAAEKHCDRYGRKNAATAIQTTLTSIKYSTEKNMADMNRLDSCQLFLFIAEPIYRFAGESKQYQKTKKYWKKPYKTIENN